MLENWTKILTAKNAISFFKFIFQVLCFIILIYQFVDITNRYLDFPYDVKLNLKDFNGLDLPSITFCLRRDVLWEKTNFQSISNFFEFKLILNNFN